jgi:hypothetical protein
MYKGTQINLKNSTIERYKRGRLNGDLLKEFQDIEDTLKMVKQLCR